jgi:superfamily II DNA or RNA helicase
MSIDELMSRVSIEPRPYQKRVIEKSIEHFLKDDINSILIESPTGSGKTVMALSTVNILQQKLGISVGWVAMRRYLLDQMQEENKSKGFNNKIESISMFDKSPPLVDMLVVDEAQHDSTNSCAHIHNMVKPRFILGLSATPFRADRVKLFFQKVVKDAGIRMLIREGYLSKFDHYTINEYTVDNVVKHYLKEKKKWGKTIMFFHTVQQCMEAQEKLKAAGTESEVITATTNKKEQLARFFRGEISVAINCGILTEGFDCPSLETVFCRDSGKGVTMQMCGRAFRKYPGITIKNIVQSKDTKYPFTRTADAEMQYLWVDNSWRSLKVNKEIGLMQQNILWKMANTTVTLPSMLRNIKKPGRTFGR